MIETASLIKGLDRDPPVTCQSSRNSFFKQGLFCNLRPSQVSSERHISRYLHRQSQCLTVNTPDQSDAASGVPSISSLVKFQQDKNFSFLDIPDLYFLPSSLFHILPSNTATQLAILFEILGPTVSSDHLLMIDWRGD